MTNHAIERLRERYGVEATQDDLTAACATVARGGSLLLGRQNKTERHLVVICGVPVQAVIRNSVIVTVEPPGIHRRSSMLNGKGCGWNTKPKGSRKSRRNRRPDV